MGQIGLAKLKQHWRYRRALRRLSVFWIVDDDAFDPPPRCGQVPWWQGYAIRLDGARAVYPLDRSLPPSLSANGLRSLRCSLEDLSSRT